AHPRRTGGGAAARGSLRHAGRRTRCLAAAPAGRVDRRTVRPGHATAVPRPAVPAGRAGTRVLLHDPPHRLGRLVVRPAVPGTERTLRRLPHRPARSAAAAGGRVRRLRRVAAAVDAGRGTAAPARPLAVPPQGPHRTTGAARRPRATDTHVR